MHYQHRYHAGNFADVFKHILLVSLLDALSAKPAAWSYLETHGGAGDYDLSDAAAQRTGEAQAGIARLWAARPAALERYLALIARNNPGDALRHYPGSPLLALSVAREQDRLVVCEKIPAIAAELRATIGEDARVSIHQRDGYEAAALLPPREKRGLVLVDPPFERPDEFEAVTAFMQAALKRFSNGIYAIWYPHKQRYQTDRWLRRMRALLTQEALDLQIDTGAPSEGQMHACGLLVINPPHAFTQAAPALLAAALPLLSQGKNAKVSHELWTRPA
ncbi:MAG TPA: 23S rRNA (adenine(2030)-N(6))-methyltransferase RlmJ [Fontimonas sp.]